MGDCERVLRKVAAHTHIYEMLGKFPAAIKLFVLSFFFFF